ncbi:unnamed protein product [Rhizoctonia solani]|uniref:Uncharacterized protein n=1 Tax=Rhizoctonia solani TaxID=456999 RepID=A0A8H3CT59_9AGAM|nr:unnamed protein product [Rhizoctonia solani]
MIHQRTLGLIQLFAEQPIYTSLASESNTMSASHVTPNVSIHRYPPLVARPLSGFAYVRRYAYAPEVLPLIGVVTFAVGMGIYFSTGAAFKNDVQWQPRTQPWLHTPTDRVHWDGAGGIRETVQREYCVAKEKAKSLFK